MLVGNINNYVSTSYFNKHTSRFTCWGKERAQKSIFITPFSYDLLYVQRNVPLS